MKYFGIIPGNVSLKFKLDMNKIETDIFWWGWGW